jgi:hypothetical protein
MRNPAMKIAQEAAQKAVFDEHGKPKPGVHNFILRAIEVQRPLVLANLKRLQRKDPKATAAELADILERDYLRAVTGGGAAVGATALVPGIGTIASLGLSAAATAGFLSATALYAASLAELHGIRMEDPNKASALVMAIMLGEEGTALLGALTGQAVARGAMGGQPLGDIIARSGSASGFIRSRIQKAFLKSLLRRQGSMLLGRALPFGVGAVVGGAGNLAMGRVVVANAKEAFGPMPDTIPGEVAAGPGAAIEGGNVGP